MLKFMNRKSAWLSSLFLFASASAFASGGYAAIVFNPSTGGWGSYHGAYSRIDAENGALAECGESCAGIDAYTLESGQSSLKETWAHNGWVAYAKGGSRYATSGLHGSQYEAEETALANCGGEAAGCRIVRSTSSFVYGADIDGTRE